MLLAFRPRSSRLPLLGLLLLLNCPGPVISQPDEDLRLKAGVRLFRTFLAADTDLARKQGPDGKLLVLLVASGSGEKSSSIHDWLAQSRDGGTEAKISGHDITVKRATPEALASYRDQVIAGVFLSERVADDGLHAVIRFGTEHGVIVYSPFDGDVERGVLGGLSVEATVRPYINMPALRASSVRIKPFFMGVAKIHE